MRMITPSAVSMYALRTTLITYLKHPIQQVTRMVRIASVEGILRDSPPASAIQGQLRHYAPQSTTLPHIVDHFMTIV